MFLGSTSSAQIQYKEIEEGQREIGIRIIIFKTFFFPISKRLIFPKGIYSENISREEEKLGFRGWTKLTLDKIYMQLFSNEYPTIADFVFVWLKSTSKTTFVSCNYKHYLFSKLLIAYLKRCTAYIRLISEKVPKCFQRGRPSHEHY